MKNKLALREGMVAISVKKIIFDDDKKNIISQSLKRFRRDRGLNQSELAARMQTLGVNLDQQMVSKIERNQRIVTDYELVCLCRALSITVEDLLEDFYREYKE